MTFTVKASLGKKIGYGIFDAFMCLFTVFWIFICYQAIVESTVIGATIFFVAMFLGLAALFVYAIYATLYAIHLAVTVDTNDNTLVIKRILRSPVIISIYDIISWKVKIINGKSGEASRHLIITFEGGKITVISLLDNWEKFRTYLYENAADKLNGEEGKEETSYDYLSERELKALIKEAESIPLTYEEELAERASKAVERVISADYICDCLLFKNDKESFLESYKDCLCREWIGNGPEESKGTLDVITFDILPANSTMLDFFSEKFADFNCNPKTLNDEITALQESLEKDIGQPINFYSTTPLNDATKEALKSVTLGSDILTLFFVEFQDYILSVMIDRFD